MTYILFRELRDLVQALNLSSDRDMLFPENVLIASDVGWGVPEVLLGDFDRLAKQHGWAFQKVQNAPAKSSVQSFASVLGGAWKRLDPYRRRFDGTPTDAELVIDPFEPNTEYIVGARTEAEAQVLLDALLTHTCGECRAIPLSVAVHSTSAEQPFQFFWSISGNRPPDMALRAAARAWWGPAGSSRTFDILVQWPYGLGIPDRVLQRIPWGNPESLILLSRDAPETLILSSGSRTSPLASLIDAGDLRPARRAIIPVAAETPSVRFRVDLRLAGRRPRQPRSARIRQLKREIAERELELERLRGDLEADNEDLDPEPLFIYYTADESEVPDEIRRLLVEWTDQPGDLDCVQYQKLDATRFPKGLDQPYTVAHVVTTSKALLRDQKDPTLGFRLFPYVPQLGARTRFDQLREWAARGLRVMAPHDHDFEIDPRFRPCDASAEKLGAALAGNRRGASGSVFLLVPNPDGGLVSFSMPVDGFRPIARSFDWDCQVEAAAAPPRVTDNILPHAREALLSGLEGALDMAAHTEGGHRLEARRNALRADLNVESARVHERSQRMHEFHRGMNGKSLFVGLDESLRDVRLAAASLRENVSRCSPDELERNVSRLREITVTLQRETTELRRVEQAVENLERQMKSWS
jgi:hypothetical protein